MRLFFISRRASNNVALACMVITLAIGYSGSSMGQGSPCDAAMSRRLATAYALSLLYPGRFVNYVQQEGPTLSSSVFRRCIEAVANAMSTGALNQPSSQEIYERSMDIASRAGTPELGPKVADGMMQTQGNYTMVAYALNQMSAILAGNLAYENSLLYQNAMQQQLLTQIWEMAGAEPEFWEQYMQMLFEVTRDFMEFVALSIR